MKISMRWATILISILLVWGTHFILTPSSYFQSERILMRHARDIMVNISDLTVEQSFNHLYKAKSAASLAKLLLGANVIAHDISGTETLERYFFDQLSIHPHLAGIYFGTPVGSFFYVSRSEDKGPNGYRTKIIRNGEQGRSCELIWRDQQFNIIARDEDPNDKYDPRARPWYKNALLQNNIVWTDPYIFYTSQKPGITIAGPSYTQSGKLQGIVGVDIDIGELSTFIGKLRVGKSGQAFMLNRNGDIIAYKDIDKFIINSDEKDKLRLAKVGELGNPIISEAFNSLTWQYDEKGNLHLPAAVFTSFKNQGKDYMAMFTPFPDQKLPWIIGVYLPEDDYLGEIKRNRKANIVSTIFLSFIASLIALIFARTIVRPVTELQKGAKAIANNDMVTTFNANSIYHEIQDTTDSFSKMKSSLIDYREQLEERERLHTAITSTANDAIILIDHQEKISYLNPAAEKIFGLSQQEAVGANFLQTILPPWLLSQDKGKAIREKFKQLDRSGRALEFAAINAQGNEIPVELSISSLLIKDDLHKVAIIRDASERKKSENAKKRLVNDLHDGMGGNLTNIKLLAEMNVGKTTDPDVKKVLANIAEICGESMTEIRSYMSSLDYQEASWKNLIADLRQYCMKTLDPYKVKLHVEQKINKRACPPSSLMAMNLFKIIKEGMTNIIKHAKANSVTLKINIDEEFLRCQLADDGQGIACTKEDPQHGRGLLSMRTRCLDLGGEFNITSDHGVTIEVIVPLTITSDYQVCLEDREV